MREMSMTEQRYQAVLAVVGEGRSITEVAAQWRVSRQTLHAWLSRYEEEGLEGLSNKSCRPQHCPHQMAGEAEALVLELRRAHRYWGAHRLVVELAKKHVEPLPSESAVYRCLVRAGVIDPQLRHRRRENWKRWERGLPMELWQFDVVHGFLLRDGTPAKALTGLDDHSRYCVSARLMPRERTQLVCDGFQLALTAYGVPEQVLTDNGKVFTGKYSVPPVEVLFDRICRENGVEHLLTKPRMPTTTGKIERFHRTMRLEFDTTQVFTNLEVAQQALDEWVAYYNAERPHQALGDQTPASRFQTQSEEPRKALPRPERDGDQWVSRRIARNGTITVGYQQFSVGKNWSGSACDVLVTDQVLQCWAGNELLKTVARNSRGDIRKKHAQGTAPQA
ncbi:MAG TPA: IS481 family transposase [Candidatus Solibacter sp.]|jgi:transposase InsO family protein|nr:IS481 family transposase [Candidatus Solibacter sp.]